MGVISDATTALGLTVLAETGDKSQLLLIALAARWQRAPVAIGGVIGITSVQVIAVLAGGWLGSRANDRLSSVIAVVIGIAFVLLGVAALASARHRSDGDDDSAPGAHAVSQSAPTWRATAGATAGLLFFAELGDKTMFTTAALSAVRSPLAVLLGASAAFALLATIAVLIGGAFVERVPERALKLLAGVAFLITGAVTIVTA